MLGVILFLGIIWHKSLILYFQSSGRINLLFSQNGDEIDPLSANEIAPLSAYELPTLSHLCQQRNPKKCINGQPFNSSGEVFQEVDKFHSRLDRSHLRVSHSLVVDQLSQLAVRYRQWRLPPEGGPHSCQRHSSQPLRSSVQLTPDLPTKTQDTFQNPCLKSWPT